MNNAKNFDERVSHPTRGAKLNPKKDLKNFTS